MTLKRGRTREVQKIRQANRAAAVGKLMLGKIKSWHEFLQVEIDDLENLPRRHLRSGFKDVKVRLRPEIKKFCSRNFQGMDEHKLSLLYEEIKSFRGFEIPLSDFEKRFAKVRQKVLKGNPKHLTIVFSLWGLQFKFPEDYISKDLIQSLHILSDASREIQKYRRKAHNRIKSDRKDVKSLIQRKEFACRSSILNCFNLMEAYLNGIAWEFIQTADLSQISNGKRKLLEDKSRASFRDKLLKYPNIISGEDLWQETDSEFEAFSKTLKPFRDALVHASPFSAPERFGGYDKLRLFYRVDEDTAFATAQLLLNLLNRIQGHVAAESLKPEWLVELEAAYKELKS